MIRRLENTLRQGAKKRLGLVFGLGGIFWILLIARLFQIQILQGKEIQGKAQSQNFKQASQKGERGTIYDRQGIELAQNTLALSFFAVPDSITSPRTVATKFGNFLQKDFNSLYKNLKGEKKFVWLARQLENEKAQRVKSWSLKGVYSREESKRTYPLGDVAQDLLGLTDIDNRGISGLELYYDSLLAGRDGYEIWQKDATGQVYEIKEQDWKEAQPGKSLVLTLDAKLQWVLESRLKQGIIRTKSNSGFGILMNPQTGEILAIASLSHPDFPEGESQGRLRPVTDQFEPGSTMKAFTAAAALEEQIKSPADLIYAEKGKWATGIGKRIIRDIHQYEMLTFQEAFAYSSNIAFAKTGLAVGSELLYKYFRNFGFGFKTGLELPGEARGSIQPLQDWSKITVITNSYGYGISATALQLACGYAAIANGGKLMKPFLVKAILDEKGNLVAESKPTFIRQVIGLETAQTLKEFLRQSVEIGTAMTAKLEGVEIGGKTGTARKVKTGSKGYLNQYLSSFVGFFPVDQPRYVGIIVLDSPQGMHYGGQTAAPVFKEIVRDILSLPSTPTHQLVKNEYPPTGSEPEIKSVSAKLEPRPKPNSNSKRVW